MRRVCLWLGALSVPEANGEAKPRRRMREAERLVRRARDVLGHEGVVAALRRSIDKACVYVVLAYRRKTVGTRAFSFAGSKFSYFVHPYNATWRNERSVEIPLASAFLNEMHGGAGLEVGNVMSHYLATGHTVVDKYERGLSVINVDVLEFEPPNPLDYIVSVSTLEHVGWDEVPRDPQKVRAALEHLRRMLLPNGRLWVSCPLGHNSYLDQLICTDRLEPVREGFLHRAVPTETVWHEVPKEVVTKSKSYGPPGETRFLWIAEFDRIADGDGI